MKIRKNKGITLISLVITIIVLIILAGISINLVLGENGLFTKAKNAATETAKARFVEDAGFAYSEAYIEKVEKSNANDITIGDVVSKLKSSYGYSNEQIKMVSSGVLDITLSETEIELELGETKEITATLGNGTYYVLIEGLYYPITLSNGEITLGNGVASLPEGDGTTTTIEAKATTGNELVEVTVDGTTITIKAKEDKEGEATITVTCGSISKKITVTIREGKFKQGEEANLGLVTVTVNGGQQTLEQSWKYFYNDKENDRIWLIYSGILEGEALQNVNQVQVYDGNFVKAPTTKELFSYLNGEGNYANAWNYIEEGLENALKAKEISVSEGDIEVKGSPNVELFLKAYNKMYPTENLETQNYQFRFGGVGAYSDAVEISNYESKTLFCLNGCYYIASLGKTVNTIVMSGVWNERNTIGACWPDGSYSNCFGVRPVFSIPKSIFEQLVD